MSVAERFVARGWSPHTFIVPVPVLADTSEAASFVSEVLQQESLVGERAEIVLSVDESWPHHDG
jgi:hypothetical protein